MYCSIVDVVDSVGVWFYGGGIVVGGGSSGSGSSIWICDVVFVDMVGIGGGFVGVFVMIMWMGGRSCGLMEFLLVL